MIREQQKNFADEHLRLREKNATQAAINAGYSSKTAASQASQLLKNPKVLEYLKERKMALSDDLRNEFLFDALEARKAMHKILTSPYADDKDIINVAKDFLDRAGFKPQDKLEVSGEIKTSNPLEGLSTEDLKKLIDDD